MAKKEIAIEGIEQVGDDIVLQIRTSSGGIEKLTVRSDEVGLEVTQELDDFLTGYHPMLGKYLAKSIQSLVAGDLSCPHVVRLPF